MFVKEREMKKVKEVMVGSPEERTLAGNEKGSEDNNRKIWVFLLKLSPPIRKEYIGKEKQKMEKKQEKKEGEKKQTFVAAACEEK